MAKIGILSDTHGSHYYFDRAMEILKGCKYIIHCGDVLPSYSIVDEKFDKRKLAFKLKDYDNFYIVKGNGDFKKDENLIDKIIHSPYLLLKIDKYKFFITHSHEYSYMDMLYKAEELGANIICYGHTHVKHFSDENGILVLNPGSVSIPRDKTHSCVVIDNNKILFYDIITKEIIFEKEINL